MHGQDLNGSRTYQLILQKLQLLPDASVTRRALIASLPVKQGMKGAKLEEIQPHEVKAKELKAKEVKQDSTTQESGSEDEKLVKSPVINKKGKAAVVSGKRRKSKAAGKSGRSPKKTRVAVSNSGDNGDGGDDEDDLVMLV